MRILNELDEEITPDEVDLELGHLDQDYIMIQFHEATPEVGEVGHMAPTVVFADGEVVEFDDYDDDNFVNGVFDPPEDSEYYGKEVERVVERYVITQPYIPAKEAWFENEEILRYTLYTPEELEERAEQKRVQEEQAKYEAQQQMRLSNAIAMVDNLVLVEAKAVGDYSETEAQVGDLTLVMADIIGA